MPRGDVRIQIDPSIRGLRTDLPTHLVPDGYLIGGSNVVCRDGVIITRAGLDPIVSTAPSANRVMGLLFYQDHTETNRLIAGTTAGFHLYTGGTSWSNITGSALTGGTGDQVRFAVFKLSNNTRVIAVNDVDAPQLWSGSGNFATLGGTPPIAKCVTSAFQRVILGNVTVSGVRRSSSLWISGFQDHTVWSSTNEVSLPDTGDSIVEVRSLNDQVFAIYKDRSQWVGIGAGSIFPFVFELRDQQVGPVSPASVVTAENKHYYLGQDGNFYSFDGSRCMAIGTHVRRTVQADIDWSNGGQAHGHFDLRNREIIWYWPNTVGGTGGIVYRLETSDIPAAFSPLLSFSFILSASTDWLELGGLAWNDLTSYTWNNIAITYPTWDSFGGSSRPGLVIGRSNGQVYKTGDSGTDDGNSFLAEWQTPFKSYAGPGAMNRVDVIESFFKQETSSVTAEIILVGSTTMNSSGTEQTAQSIDLSSSSRLRATYEDVQDRFISIKHKIPSTSGGREYRGSVLYLYGRGEQ